MIAQITSAKIITNADNGMRVAIIGWTDTKGRRGATVGDPKSEHIKALLARAKREGKRGRKRRHGAHKRRYKGR